MLRDIVAAVGPNNRHGWRICHYTNTNGIKATFFHGFNDFFPVGDRCGKGQLVVLATAYSPAQRIRTGATCGCGKHLDPRQIADRQTRSHPRLLAEMGQIRGQPIG